MLKLLIAKLVSLFTGLREICSAIKRDLLGLWLVFVIETKLKRDERNGLVVDDMFDRWAREQPDRPCIIFNDSIWTFHDMRIYSNRIANLFAKQFKLKKGDCVAVFMDNKPEYAGIWLGLSKLGVITALINTNLKGQQLMHTFENAKPKLVIYSIELESAIKTVKVELNGSLKVMSENELSEHVKQTSDDIYIPTEKVLPQDVIMYIYTSGTTGLPKPAVIKHSRYCAGGHVFFKTSGLKAGRDIVYVTLPIYHANGAIIGVGAALISGATVVLRKKFSATNFWSECIRYKCTAFIYVGEICRYLVNQPVSPLDRQHTIRVAIGNGLRENVWREFKNRFGVKCYEFYAASEGNCTMVNITSKIGACGFVPLINSLVPVLPSRIIRIDEHMNPVRDERGFCQEACAGEKGLLVGIIGKSTKTAFNGYANNPQASSKKIIENLFHKGQRAFNSGDLMMKDWLGYVHFCDRLGDTFRWRGENVATIEVENIISRHLNAAEVCVYGVEIPGQEGRCGMAAIAKADLADPRPITRPILDELPPYARPLFIRLVDQIDHTGSFKAKKTRLVEEAYNIGTYKDTVYYLNAREQNYKLLTHAVYLDIINGNYSF